MNFKTIKKFFVLFVIMTQSLIVVAQNHEQSIFIMVDLSVNIAGHPNPIDAALRQNAIDFTKSIITATYKSSDFPNWEKTGVPLSPEISDIIKGKGKKLIGTGNFLMIMPFGELKTSENFQINEIRSYPSDFDSYYNFPFTYSDKDTWGNYAEAKVCNIAYNYKIPEYYIIRIQGKPDDPNSVALSTNDQNMIDTYETGAKSDVIAKFKHTSSVFSVTIKKMDITKIPGINKQTKIVVRPKNVTKKSLRIVSPKGEIKNPFKTEKNKIRVSWVCIGCDSIPTYTLRVNDLNTKKTKTYKLKDANNKSLTLEPSNYKISISTKGANSNAQYIEITKESSGGFNILFVLIILGVAGYFGYNYFIKNKKMNDKKEDDWVSDNKDAGIDSQSGNETENSDWN